MGLVIGLIFGIASLIIGVIIAFVIVSTLTGAGLMTSGRTTANIINESVDVNSDAGATLAKGSLTSTYSCGTITQVLNTTNLYIISSANYTQVGCNLKNTTSDATIDYTGWRVTYPYTLKSNEEYTTEKLSANFTAGVDNVSSKVPTVLLVAAIVLILGVLGLLVMMWQKMRVGSGGI